MSIHFELDMDIQHTDRTSYDVLNMTSDVGGVLEILTMIFKLIAAGFASLRIQAIFTSNMSHLSEESKQLFFGSRKLTEV